MAFIRSIKSDFFSSGNITRLTPWARLFYIATWLEADREGRFKWDHQTLKNRYFPADDDVWIKPLGEELEKAGLVKFYESDGNQYAWIPTFKTHQVINNRERPSVLPSPQKERNGKERKGKERKERESRVDTPLSRVDGFQESWEKFKKHRKAMKATMTEHAEELAIKTLETLMDEGNDPKAVMERSILNGWKGLFELNEKPGDAGISPEQAAIESEERRRGKREDG